MCYEGQTLDFQFVASASVLQLFHVRAHAREGSCFTFSRARGDTSETSLAFTVVFYGMNPFLL